MTQHSPEYHRACAVWLEEVLTSPKKTLQPSAGISTHFDPRMRLSISDCRLSGDGGPKVMAPLVSSKA